MSAPIQRHDLLSAMAQSNQDMRRALAELSREISDVAQVVKLGGPMGLEERSALLAKLERMTAKASALGATQ